TSFAFEGGYYTFEYDKNGNLQWIAINPTGNASSLAYGMVEDSAGNIIVTGQARHTLTYYYASYKLSPVGGYIWTNLYPTPQFGTSGARAVAVDASNNLRPLQNSFEHFI
ncbi:MAG TPA: hypothetical protein VKV04_14370, partial [Verrucomicrobiae bacterium]|nr:hypothetical protein [Verrucomicrobiae bacterium]